MNSTSSTKRSIRILGGALFLAGLLFARQPGDTLYLSLSDCIRIGQEQSPLAEMARSSFRNKEHRYRSFNAGFLPQLSITADAPQFVRSISSITQPDGSNVYLSQRQSTSTLSLGLSQRIPLTGTQISIFSGLNRLDNFETNTAFYRSTPLSLSVRQPLFSINPLAWNSEVEDFSYRAARCAYVEGMEEAAVDVVNKFFGYHLATMNVSNAKLNVATNDTLYEMSRGRYNVGKIAENDLLQSELALLNARTQYQSALVELNRAAQSLNFVLRLPALSVVVILPGENIPKVQVDQEKALVCAREFRSDEINLRVQELVAARGVRQAESDNSLSMSISANIGINQKANELNAVYRDLLDQQQFSVQLQVPLVGWGVGSHAIEAARAEETRVHTSIRSQRFTIDQEVQYQVQRFRQLQWQVGVAAKADTIARRRFEVARDRFVIGKIDIPNLFLAQSEKDNAYRARIQALWDFWTTYYQLRRLTLYDFANDRALIQEGSP